MTTQSNTEETVTYDANLGLEFNFDDNIESEFVDNANTVLADKITKPDNNKSEEVEIENIDINKVLEKEIEAETETPGLVDTDKTIIEKVEQVPNSNIETDKDTSSSTVAFGRYLQEQGSFNFDEDAYKKNIEEKGEAKAFLELLEDRAKEQADTHIKSLDNYSKEYIDFRKAGFSREDASNYVSERETIDTISEEQLTDNETLQVNIIKQVSKLRGMSEEEINDNIDLLKDTDKLAERAKTHLSVLQQYYKDVNAKRIEDEKTNKQLEETANNTYFEELRKEIDQTDEYIKDKKVNKQTKDKIYNLISTPIKLESGGVTNGIWEKRSQDPKSFDKKLAYYIVTGLFDGDTKDITTDARTKVLSDLEKTLTSNTKFNVGSPVISKEDKNLSSKLEEMRGIF